MSEKTEVPLVAAAARVRRGYNVVLGLILRGEIIGRQDDRGRWMVSLESLEKWYVRDRSASPRARRAKA